MDTVRKPDGRFDKGATPGPGRTALPAWFKGKGNDSLALLWAAASGEVIDGLSEQVRATATALATDIDPKTRVQALDKVVERLHGKVKEHVEVEGTGAADVLLDALLRMAHPRKEGQNEPHHSDDDGADRGGS